LKVGLVLLENVSNPSSALRWLTGYLKAIGVEVSHYVLKSGELGRIRAFLSENDALLVVGGAGYREVVEKIAEALGLGVEVNSEALERVRMYYSDSVNVPRDLEEKATVPEFSYIVPNERGPVPGFVAFSLMDDKFIAATPPRFEEAVECFEMGIQDFFREKTGKKYSLTFTLSFDGAIEEAERLVQELSSQAEGAFIRLDARFMGRKGVPVVFTLYATTPEELSDRMTALESKAAEIAGKMGRSFVEKTPEVGGEEL